MTRLHISPEYEHLVSFTAKHSKHKPKYQLVNVKSEDYHKFLIHDTSEAQCKEASRFKMFRAHLLTQQRSAIKHRSKKFWPNTHANKTNQFQHKREHSLRGNGENYKRKPKY